MARIREYIAGQVKHYPAEETESKAEKNIITIGFIGEADIDTNETPEKTYQDLFNIAEQCGYFVVFSKVNSYCKEITIQTPQGVFHISYVRQIDGEKYTFDGVYTRKRIQ